MQSLRHARRVEKSSHSQSVSTSEVPTPQPRPISTPYQNSLRYRNWSRRRCHSFAPDHRSINLESQIEPARTGDQCCHLRRQNPRSTINIASCLPTFVAYQSDCMEPCRVENTSRTPMPNNVQGSVVHRQAAVAKCVKVIQANSHARSVPVTPRWYHLLNPNTARKEEKRGPV